MLNKRLAHREFVAGEYSFADRASHPWFASRVFDLAGAGPAYAGHAVFGAVRWLRGISPTTAAAEDDPVPAWVERKNCPTWCART